MTTEVSKWLRQSTLDCIFSETLLTTDFVEKNNINAEIEKYEKYAYIDELDSYDSIKELIESTPDENAKYNVSESQLKRIADSINNETYFEVVEQITKEVIEFRNKILGIEKDNTSEANDVAKSDLNNHAVNSEEKSEIEEDTNNEEVKVPTTIESKDSDTNEVQNEANEIEKKRVFDKLKTKENIMPQPTPEKVVDETPQATAIPDSYRVLFGGDKR